MKTIIISFKIFLFLTILTGIVYPVLITCIAQISFNSKANGSMVFAENKAVGSELIGQTFDGTIYFSSRPSATGYNPLPSGGSNFGITNSKLINQVSERKRKFLAYNSLDSLSDLPSEMLFASASGLDPHISPESALIQVERISKARNFNGSQKETLNKKIRELIESPQFGFLGNERINVLKLNLALNELSNNHISNY
jgi:K+-transporting ATPase ATPase C chain